MKGIRYYLRTYLHWFCVTSNLDIQIHSSKRESGQHNPCYTFSHAIDTLHIIYSVREGVTSMDSVVTTATAGQSFDQLCFCGLTFDHVDFQPLT